MESLNKDDQTRESQVDKIVDFLDHINAYEFFKELRLNPDKLKDIEFEQFEKFITRINGIARDIPIVKRHADGDGVYLEGFVDSASVPDHRDKVPLLKHAYESIPNLADPEDVSYMIPLIINAVHLFEDGNGRSSRILHLLLRAYNSKEEFNEELKKAIGKNGRYESYNISPGLIGADVEKIVLMNHGINFGTENYGWDPIAPVEVPNFWTTLEKPQSDKGKEFMKLVKDDFQLCFVCAYNYLKKRGLLAQTLVTYQREETLTFLSPMKMDEILQPEDWDNLIIELNKLKKEKVEVMIKSFVEPEKYRVLDGSTTLKDGLIQKVLKEYEDNKGN